MKILMLILLICSLSVFAKSDIKVLNNFESSSDIATCSNDVQGTENSLSDLSKLANETKPKFNFCKKNIYYGEGKTLNKKQQKKLKRKPSAKRCIINELG